MEYKEKILKIYLADLVHDYLPGNYIVPLNVGLIATYLKHKFGNKVEIKLFKSFEILLEEFRNSSKPDIVGFSSYAWNQQLNKHLMSLIISESPKTVIVAGGPYPCTFCVWGISALNKVRLFPLERILQEIEYMAEKSPAVHWLFADANFGIIPQDLEIAKKVKYMANKYGKLKWVQVFWAKNSSKHTLEISKIFGNLVDPCAAVQSFDKTVLKNIKRDNIRMESMTDLLEHWKKDNLKVSTNVIVGLPGETLQSQLETLRQAINHGFSEISTGNIILLPGSEMETDQSRKTFGLKTKYRLLSGGYGKYNGIPILDFEESVRSSNHITEEEMHFLRIVHFFVWAFWNLGVGRTLLEWIHIKSGKNPLDVLLDLIKPGTSPELDQFVSDFDIEARSEWFETPDELIQYYTKNFDDLIANGFMKLNLKYLAKILLDNKLAKLFIDALIRQYPSNVSEQLGKFCYDRIFFLDSPTTKKIQYNKDTIEALKMIYPHIDFDHNTCYFEQKEGFKDAINFELRKFEFKKDPLNALTLTLESFRKRFLYDFSFSTTGRKESTGEIIGEEFNYRAQVEPVAQNS